MYHYSDKEDHDLDILDKLKHRSNMINQTQAKQSAVGQIMAAGQKAEHRTREINFSVTKANGGWVVRTTLHGSFESGELHVIPDGADFDSELGKIVTYTCLKQQ